MSWKAYKEMMPTVCKFMKLSLFICTCTCMLIMDMNDMMRINHKVTFIVPQTIERLSWLTPRVTGVIEKRGVNSDFYSTSRLCKDQPNRPMINVRTIPRLGDGHYI